MKIPAEKASIEVSGSVKPSCQYSSEQQEIESNDAPAEKLRQSGVDKVHAGNSKKASTDPYAKEFHQCIFCRFNIPLDYKNVQLLSQFVSPQTGMTYSQKATGLCIYKYTELEKTVLKSKRLGFMPFFFKETIYRNDKELFDPMKNNLNTLRPSFDKRKLNSEEIIEDINERG